MFTDDERLSIILHKITQVGGMQLIQKDDGTGRLEYWQPVANPELYRADDRAEAEADPSSGGKGCKKSCASLFRREVKERTVPENEQVDNSEWDECVRAFL